MERLPEGFKRIGYDSDTAKFTFRDRNGCLYQGEPGADYGILTPMSAAESSRPNAFSSGTFILYTIQLSVSSTILRHQIHPPYHHPQSRPPVNKNKIRHFMISYPLNPLLPLHFPKATRALVLSNRLQLSKIS